MSQKMKLNTEVDRMLKAIQERAEEFDSSWNSLQVAETQKIREKYEEEVNREIKKLQRMREQVRAWIAGGIVKDDEPLQKARRDIETRMEKLRDYEREAKTKLYSRAGLASDKIDPVEKSRREARSWLAESISKLNCEIEQHESELDVMEGANNRKKLDNDKLEKMDFLSKTLKSHQHHLGKFEQVLRMLDNETLVCDLVFGLKDEFEYYLENAANGMLSDIDHISYTGIEFDKDLGEIKSAKSAELSSVVAPTEECLDVSSRSVVPESMDMVIGDSPTSVRSMAVSDTSSIATTGSKSSFMSAAIPPRSRLPKQSKATSKIFLHHTKTIGSDHHTGSFGSKASSQTSHKPTAGRTIKRTNSKKLAVGKDANSPTKISNNPSMVALPLPPGESGLPRPGEMPTRRKSFAELVSQPLTRGTNASSRSRPPIPRATVHYVPTYSMPPPKTPEAKILQTPKRIWNAWEDKVEKESDQIMQVDKETSPASVTHNTPSSAEPAASPQSGNEKGKPRTVYVTPPSSSYMDTTDHERSAKEISQMTDYQIKLSLQKAPDPMPAPTPFSIFKDILPRSLPPLLPKEPSSGEKAPSSRVPSLTTPTPSSSSSNSGQTGNWKVPSVPSVPVMGNIVTGWPPLLAWPLPTSSPASRMPETAVINTMRSAAMANPTPINPSFEAPFTWMSSYREAVPPANEFFGTVGQKYVFTSTTPSPATTTFAGPSAPIPSPANVFESIIRYRLSTEVLFYMFYFDKDSQLRTTAAKDLEARNWSFHIKLSVWMQRMNFPRVQTEVYEKGNFRYWDREQWKEEQLFDFLVEYCCVRNPSEELSGKAKA